MFREVWYTDSRRIFEREENMSGKKAASVDVSDLLNDLAKLNNTGPVQWLKPGTHTFKLLMPEGRTDIRGFYEHYIAMIKGTANNYFLVPAVILATTDTNMPVDPKSVRYIKLPRTGIDGIVNQGIKKKWDLFNPVGVTITIEIVKTAAATKYDVSVNAQDDHFDASEAVFPEQSIADAALDQSKIGTEKKDGRGEEDLL